MVINFDFRSGAKKSGHLDYPLQSYGPNNTAYLGTKSETNIFKFRCILGPSAIKKGRLLAQPSYLNTLKPIKHFSGSLNFFPKCQGIPHNKHIVQAIKLFSSFSLLIIKFFSKTFIAGEIKPPHNHRWPLHCGHNLR